MIKIIKLKKIMNIEMTTGKPYKVILIGDRKVGKTSLISRYKTSKFLTDYVPTDGADIISLAFHTNKGIYNMDIWDCSGGLDDLYYTNVDGCIIMFDINDQKSYNNCSYYIKTVQQINEKVPIILCGNKTDLPPVKIKRNPLLEKYICWEISVKSGVGFKMPARDMLQEIIHEELVFY
jgi:small GTP-binding protein